MSLFDYSFLVLVVIGLAYFLLKNKQIVSEQLILAVGKFPILSLYMARTGWGLQWMDRIAKKYPVHVRTFGYIATGLGFIGIAINFVLLAVMVWQLFQSPQVQQVGLVLPFTNIPGLGFLSFTHWIIALAFLATIHELAHGVVARAYKVPVHNSGFAVFTIFRIPLIPAAFVEPDPKTFPKQPDIVQYSVLGAGPAINFLVAIPFLLLMLFVLQPASTAMTQPIGISFSQITPDMPASLAGIQPNHIYTTLNDDPLVDAQNLMQVLLTTKPGEIITLGNATDTIAITTTSQEGRTVIGVVGLTNERDFTEQYKPYSAIFNWFSELIRWLFVFNLMIGLINLMPIFVTDGGQIVKVFALQLYPKDEKKAMRLYAIVNQISLGVLLIAAIVPVFF